MIFPVLGSLRRWAVPALLAGALAACATPDQIATHSDTAFQRTGRFALTVDHVSGKQDAVQGGFAWLDAGRGLALDLTNPLGSTLARVTVSGGTATLTHSNGAQEVAPDADRLVEKVLGSPIPVSGLRYWLQGQTGPARAHDTQRDGQGRLTEFNQEGWRVRLSRYDTLGPTLLQLNRNEAARDIRLRLAVTSVAANPPGTPLNQQ